MNDKKVVRMDYCLPRSCYFEVIDLHLYISEVQMGYECYPSRLKVAFGGHLQLTYICTAVTGILFVAESVEH